MRAIILTICTLAFFGAPVTDAIGQQQWSEYRPAGAGYRIEMPGTPKVHTTESPHYSGVLLKARWAEVQLPAGIYAVLHTDLPQETIAKNDSDSILDGARDGAVSFVNVRGNKATLRSERRLTINGFPARQLVMDVPGIKAAGVMRIVLVGNRQIMTFFVGHSGSETSPDVTRFIDSFVVLNAQTSNFTGR
jgi:hypothetical protein